MERERMNLGATIFIPRMATMARKQTGRMCSTQVSHVSSSSWFTFRFVSRSINRERAQKWSSLTQISTGVCLSLCRRRFDSNQHWCWSLALQEEAAPASSLHLIFPIQSTVAADLGGICTRAVVSWGTRNLRVQVRLPVLVSHFGSSSTSGRAVS